MEPKGSNPTHLLEELKLKKTGKYQIWVGMQRNQISHTMLMGL